MIKDLMLIFFLMLCSAGFVSKAAELRYLYSSHGGLIGFYDDEKVRRCLKCDPVAANIAQMQKNEPYTRWHATDNVIIWNGADELPFFNDEGIAPEWLIFDSEPVLSAQMVTKYQFPGKDKIPNDVLELKDTTLVLIEPPQQKFRDKNSAAAQDYGTAMDDWSFYAAELTRYFSALKVPVLSDQRHRFVITLNNGQRRIFDANHIQTEEDDVSWGAVLYRKGHLPIVLDITDSEPADAKRYLGLQ